MRQPRLAAAVGRDCGPCQITGRRPGLRHLEYRGEDVPPLLELSLLARRGGLPDQPRAPEIRAVPRVRDARIGPEHVACGKLALGGEQRQRQIACGGPGPLGLGVRHHLPDGLEHVRGRSVLECLPHELCRQIDLAHTGSQRVLDIGHRLLGDAARTTDTRDLIRGLDQLGRPDDLRGIRWRTRRKDPVGGPAHRAGHLVDRHIGAGTKEVRHDSRELFDALVEFEVERAVNVIGRYLGLEGRPFAERDIEVRVLVVGQHDRHRPLDVRQSGVQKTPTRARRVDHVAVAEQDQCVDALVRHRRAQPGADLTQHPAAVGLVGNPERGQLISCERGHSTPRNFLMFPLTILAALSGPTASTTEASDFSE